MTDITDAQPARAYHWPLYQGTKQLKAISMSKEVYCALRGWTVPADEDPNEVGYVVEYQDGGKPNVAGFAGYVSWSPADVFEKAYRPCGSHVERMTIEFEELNERIDKLTAFVDESPVHKDLPEIERALLYSQLQAMSAYSCILETRIRKAWLTAGADTSAEVASIAGRLMNLTADDIRQQDNLGLDQLVADVRDVAASALGQRGG